LRKRESVCGFEKGQEKSAKRNGEQVDLSVFTCLISENTGSKVESPSFEA